MFVEEIAKKMFTKKIDTMHGKNQKISAGSGQRYVPILFVAGGGSDRARQKLGTPTIYTVAISTDCEVGIPCGAEPRVFAST